MARCTTTASPAKTTAAGPAKRFRAALEPLQGGLGWVVAWVPFDVETAWKKMVRLRVMVEVGGQVFRTSWPVADEELAREDALEIPVQANGKLVTVVKVPVGSDDATVKGAALADAKVQARIEGKTVVKVIVVPGKLVNLVVK